MSDKGNKPRKWLAISLLLMILGTVLAYLFNTSFFSVTTTEISFKTDKGVLNGLLYMPKGADAAHPRPTIVTTHGYLNAKEMQDAPAIELSRRGYVVLALDSYEHGDSYLTKNDINNAWFGYWPASMSDAVQYMYGQPYVKKDEKGNGLIAVGGHSMGGFSSTMAAFMDEQQYQQNLKDGKPAVRKVFAILTAGSDFLYTSYLGVNEAVADKALADRTAGKIAAQYDEFFFNAAGAKPGDTMVKKDYVSTVDGKAFLGNPATPQANVFYPGPEGGKRIIYQPGQMHAWNHFSGLTTGYQIQFYAAAFGQYAPSTTLASTNQIWFWKETFEFLGLIGFFMLFIALLQILVKKPLFQGVQTEALEFDGPKTSAKKAIFWLLVALSAAIPAVFYATLMGKLPAGLSVLKYFSLIVTLLAGIAVIVELARKKADRVFGLLLIAASSFVTFGLTAGASALFNLSPWFNEPQTNALIYWAVVVTGLVGMILSIVHFTINGPARIQARHYGFAVGWQTVLKSLLVAVVIAAAGYIILFIVDALFQTDFRIWLFAVRAFNTNHLITALGYMPFFFLYFFINGIALQINTNSRNLQGAKGYLVAFFMNIGGLLIWQLIQYGMLYGTGTAAWPSVNLNSITLYGTLAILFTSTLLTKKFLDTTNNVYAGAFLNTIVVTLIAISTSTMYIHLQ
ncbi:MAG: hypothetical protein WCQ50_00380 [Spirochaetota bacterium]